MTNTASTNTKLPDAAGVQGLVIGPALNGAAVQPPRLLRGMMKRLPILSAVPAYIVGVGFRPERAPAWARRRTAQPRGRSGLIPQ